MNAILPDLLAALIVLALTAYVLLAGADFGGGVWDLLASGPRKDAQRELIARAITPVWEANHVWLIFVVVVLFTCFPPAFARIAVVLHVPLALLLFGIVLRGSAFIFRAYDVRPGAARWRWGRTFAVASLVTPVLLGVCIGALASERVTPPTGGFLDGYVRSWATPFAFTVGLFALVLFAFLAATYLTLESGDADLREDFRRRALGAAVVLGGTALLVGLLSHAAAPRIRAGLTTAPWAIPLQLNTAAVAVAALWALWTRRFALARLAAGLQAALVLWGWAFAQYPYLVPPDLDIAVAAAPAVTLRLVLLGTAGGMVVLVPSLWYLLRVFKAHPGGQADGRTDGLNP